MIFPTKKQLYLFLTATGAWFTASQEKAYQDVTASYTFADFITITASNNAASTIQAKTAILGVEQNLASGSALHPGDKIYVADGTVVTFTASDTSHNFWYAVSTNGGSTYSTPVAYVAASAEAGDEVLYTTTLTKSISSLESDGETSNENYQWNDGGYYLIKTSLTQSDVAGDTITVTIAGCNVVVKACQYNNVADASAAATVMGITVA